VPFAIAGGREGFSWCHSQLLTLRRSGADLSAWQWRLSELGPAQHEPATRDPGVDEEGRQKLYLNKYKFE
jgi:hypothetical protein